MRGRDEGQRQIAAFVDINRRIPEAHPIRRIKSIADAQLKSLSASFDGRTTRHASYRLSQRLRKRVEEVFGWGTAASPPCPVALRRSSTCNCTTPGLMTGLPASTRATRAG